MAEKAPASGQASSKEGKHSSFALQPPQLSLPKGGGAVRGIGEKFSANPVTGTGAMSVPISLSPGRMGFGPQLALSYDSGSGNGPWGLGWNIGLPSISRKTDKGLPRYLDEADSDLFILSGVEDLVRTLNADATAPADDVVQLYGEDYRVRRYRPRIEGLFALIERWSHTTRAEEVFWRTISRDNTTTWFGRTSESRVYDPADRARIFQWLTSESYDSAGNAVVYIYQREDGAGVRNTDPSESNRPLAQACANTYLKRIRYGNLDPFLPELRQAGAWELPSGDLDRWMFEAVFDYGDHSSDSPGRSPDRSWAVRPDPLSSHRAGFELRTYRLCRRVLMFHHFPAVGAIPQAPEVGRDCLVRSTDLEYLEPGDLGNPGTAGYTVLSSVIQRSYQRRTITATSYEQRQLPPLQFTYSPIEVDPTVRTLAREELDNLPVGTQGAGYQWVDLDGEGLSGVLADLAGAWHYKPNLGEGRFGPSRVVAQQPAMSALETGRQQLMDLAGDGTIDLVDFSGPTPGFHERTADTGWKKHIPFASLPHIDWNDPNLRFIDLTGDGHADALITEGEVFTWYPSLEERGFGASRGSRPPINEEAGPRVVFSDLEQTVFLADMCGDGLTDIVRIRNGEVCYWPNLGYGRFGRKVTLNNSPRFDSPDLFDPARIRLTDIDGSGPIDIIYLGRTGAQIYFNRSGNSLSDAQEVALPLATENLAAVQAADLLGNGTACLVWNSHLPADAGHPVQYVRLMGSPGEDDTQWQKHAKPHLLIKVENNLGARTEIEYTPSTWFYLQDKREGTPWVTRLPFPVHCVSKVTAHDLWRGTRFSNSYSYHHGYFDGVEREFRGFGRVDQVDVEDFGTFQEANAGSPWVTDDLSLYQPPVHTITWYHTGAALDRQRILSQFSSEYFPHRFAGQLSNAPGSFVEHALPDPELPADLTADEWREALRACKGMVLRQEVYELDIDALTAQPPLRTPVRLFSVAMHNCRIRRLQPRGANRHAVFLVTESEAINYHHELALRANGLEITDLQTDPRIAHTLNLRYSAHGLLQQSITVGYARWHRGGYTWLPRPQLAHDVQSEEHIAYSETRHTNDVTLRAAHTQGVAAVRHFRLPAQCEARTYQLKNVRRASPRYFTPTDFAPLDLSDVYPPLALPSQPVELKLYHQQASGPAAQKRLVEHVRSLYFDDASDTTAPTARLLFANQGPRGLKYEDYKLALTDELLASVFGRASTSDPLADKLAWEVQAGVSARNLLLQPAIGGYVAGTAIDAALTGQLWMRSGVAGFASDAHRHFFLPERYEDAFGNVASLSYDGRDLFVVAAEDAKHNVAQVVRFDHRVLAAAEMSDISGNRSEAVFDIHGLVVGLAVKGKQDASGKWEGDHFDGWSFDDINPPAQTIAEFCNARDFTAAHEARARSWLGTATARYVYHFGEAYVAGQPVWMQRMAGACSIARETHAGQLQPGLQTAMQISLECSDGAGATLMKKLQAEPDPVSTAPAPARRWLVNGLTLLNNKGKAVKQYEPTFSGAFGCEPPQANGVSSTQFYDAPGRLVRTEFADGTLSRVVFSPWDTETWDQNDTVLESPWYTIRNSLDSASGLAIGTDGLIVADPAQRAGWLAARHAGTPARTILDSLGREVISVAHNRVEDSAGPHRFCGKQWRDDYYVTFSKLDAEGKPLWIRDARDNLVMQYILPVKPTRWVDQSDELLPLASSPCYDIAGNLLFQHSMDAGERWMFMDAAGKPMLAWDFNDRQAGDGTWTQEHRLYSTDYDALHRPTAIWLRTWSRPRPPNVPTSTPFQPHQRVMIERFEYQDAQVGDTANLNGQLVGHYEPSGLTSTVRRDFKGNVQRVHRALVNDPEIDHVDWASTSDANGRSKLAPEVYIQITEHDALGRMRVHYNWHRANRPVAVYEPLYNERGSLRSETLRLRATKTAAGHVAGSGQLVQAITEVRYNAKGQKTWLALGNGTVTRYTYDALTFRLTRLWTRRTQPQFSGDCASAPNDDQPLRPCGVQNLRYTYDPVGNITHVHDDAQQTIYFNGGVAEPSSDYTYDALYRLTEATGREQAGVAGSPPTLESNWPRGPLPSDSTLRRYTQSYVYDRVGNFQQFVHAAPGGHWVRHYDHALDSNRLLVTWEGSQRANEAEYEYDPHGSMLNLRAAPDRFNLHWDHRDMIRHIDLGGGGMAHYQYDSGKQRTRKYIKRNPTVNDGTVKEERIYLGGFERYRRYTNDPDDPIEEIESHHLFEGEQRVLLVDDVLKAKPSRQPGPSGLPIEERTCLRFQYGNHLSSVGIELDEFARVISHEEFHPFGTNAYRLMSDAKNAPPKRYRYTGMERDEESGLSYHAARYCLLCLGRWASADPRGVAGGANVFMYGACNPVGFVDTLGEQPDNWELMQQSQLRQPVRATATDRGITPEHRQNAQILGKQWGITEEIQVGHVKPFGITRAGEVGDTFAQPRRENASQGAADKAVKAQAKASGNFYRPGEVDITVPKGTNFGPRPPIPSAVQGLVLNPKPLPTPTSGREVTFTIEIPNRPSGEPVQLDLNLRGPTQSVKPPQNYVSPNISFDFAEPPPPIKSVSPPAAQMEMDLRPAPAKPTTARTSPATETTVRTSPGSGLQVLSNSISVLTWFALVSPEFNKKVMTPVMEAVGDKVIGFVNWAKPTLSQQDFIDGQLGAQGSPSREDLAVMKSVGFEFVRLDESGARVWNDKRVRSVH